MVATKQMICDNKIVLVTLLLLALAAIGSFCFVIVSILGRTPEDAEKYPNQFRRFNELQGRYRGEENTDSPDCPVFRGLPSFQQEGISLGDPVMDYVAANESSSNSPVQAVRTAR